ncbi:MAG: hypothetical protein ACXVEF_32540 [Polyangiales bacterium]
MRRKHPPAPFQRNQGISRPLQPARSSSFPPTAAALAFALAGLGCSAPTADVVGADPVTPAKVSAPIASTPPAVSGGASAHIEPDPFPYELDGDVAAVKPVPVAKPAPKK